MRNKLVVCLDSVCKEVFELSKMSFKNGDEWKNYVKAYSPSTFTLQSVSSMYTGVYPHRATTVYQRLVPIRRTIFDTYKEMGYNTYIFTGIPWMSAQLGLKTPNIDMIIEEPKTDGYIRRKNTPYPLINDIVSQFKDVVEEPYFAWMQIADTHQPYVTPEHKEKDAIKLLRLTNVNRKIYEKNGKMMPEWSQQVKKLKKYQIRAVKDMDKYLKKLSKEDADMMVTADHGDNWDHKLPFGHGWYFINDYISHVPLYTRFEEEELGNPNDIISLKEIPDMFYGNKLNQEYAFIEYIKIAYKNRSFIDKNSYMMITNEGKREYKIFDDIFPEHIIKEIDRELYDLYNDSLNIMKNAKDRFNNVAFATSAGKNSTLMLYIASQVFDDMNLLFVDTGKHFEETENFISELVDIYNANLFTAKYNGETDFDIGSPECCKRLKIEPMNNVIEQEEFDAVMTAIRRDGNEAWSNETVFSERTTDNGHEYFRVHPIINFTENATWAGVKLFNLDFNRLYLKGYRSIDCEPCTDGDMTSERGGRNQQKERKMELLRKWGYM